MSAASLAIAILALAVASQAASEASVDVKKCKELGFTGEASCSACNTLAELVKDADLVNECKSCCKPDESMVKYISATLEVCPHRLSAWPEIQYFVEKMSKDVKGLKVAMIENVTPRLRLKREDGKSEVMRVEQWKRGAFAEFVKERVTAATSKKSKH
mmetsp:Transcript_27226/g.69326  ORF Transcript_27226/g.69326 Transcript_27226/m.69326 type:complete len:158 (-) Transcript_27226:142-615(-)|eukprot:CAMPEP_0202866798 /NCGR_PEP_ID=MMETSP1391-20130828/8369_1 /ASSEMBLY_ACC=CAM_ASM_000867 /TAXON_ID=1034604 /ORGANISM="Chlamydomonas leiostraca, Strain SAG 11-49" /LENGTH=157 /DNA_ID=CAMNT_0049546783 /DNA_START=128 /DNA_END=601 /DNA_ORIENTATION=+